MVGVVFLYLLFGLVVHAGPVPSSDSAAHDGSGRPRHGTSDERAIGGALGIASASPRAVPPDQSE